MKKSNTSGMKIAISIPPDIFAAVDRLAKERKTSRSDVFASAVREYLRRLETRQIIQKLNQVWSQPLTQEEADTLEHMQKSFRKTAENESFED
jgi:metal-responsive CopG/Arc/MetJ family transcriptional regulator